MSKVKFVKTTSTSINTYPITEGTFFFTTNGNFYLDMANESGEIERFIINSSNILIDTTLGWHSRQNVLLTQKGYIYIYSDYQQDLEGNDVPGFKIGNGTSYLIDLPFVDTLIQDHMRDTDIHITSEERQKWNNKVTVVIDSNDPTNLVFSID